MEKRKPAYSLAEIKAALGSAETLANTRSALADAIDLGFDRRAIVGTIQGLTSRMFY